MKVEIAVRFDRDEGVQLLRGLQGLMSHAINFNQFLSIAR
jgi:hypothetical protein